MTGYEAILLIQEPPNQDLKNLIDHIGQFGKLDLTERPLVYLDIQNGRPLLSTRDPDSLFSLVFEKHRQRKSLKCLSTAPVSDLRMLHGKTFFRNARYITVSSMAWSGGQLRDDPYYRRIVEFRYGGAEPQGDLSAPSSVEPKGTAGEYPLLVEPQSVSLSQEQVETIFGNNALAIQKINGVILPPVRSPHADSYFAARYHDVRKVLAESLKLAAPRPDEPAMVTLWRLVDDPLVRDLLEDGGGIELADDDREPTTAQMRIYSSGPDVAASYRSCVLLDPSCIAGPQWAKHVFQSLHMDLCSAIRGGLALARRSTRLEWRIEPLRPWQPGGSPDENTWEDFERLKESLPSLHTKERSVLEGEVLNLSRRRAHSNDLSNQPDGSLCQEAFISRFWRCPWTASNNDATDPWRHALIALLQSDWRDKPLSPAQRVELWAKWRRVRLETDTKPWVFHHPAVIREEVQRWRLLLPLEVVFQTHSRVILDRSSPLDRNYVLA